MAENANKIWDELVALDLAKECQVTLSKRHWEVIHALRDLYLIKGRHSATRVIIKALSTKNHASTMLELMQLFGERPLFTISFIAGLPKPPHCI